MEETRKYKQTELGLLPEDWEVVLLSDLARNFIGLTYSPDNVKEYGTLVLRSSNIQNGKICYDNNVFVDMDIPERAKVRQNDILVCVRNGSTSLIGKCAIIGELKSDTAFGAFMTILRSKDGISPNFLFYIWQSEILQQQIKNNLGATINQITNKDIDSFVVAIPPTIKEQRRIASALTSIDNLIDSLDSLIAKKRNIKQGTMQQLLSGKKRLKGFTEPWVEKKLGDIFDIKAGGDVVTSDFSPMKYGEYYYPIYSNSLDNSGLYGYTRTPRCPANSITITGRGTLGHAEYRNHEYDAVIRIIILIPKEMEIDCNCISSLINSQRPFIFESTGVPQLTVPQVLDSCIKLPSSLPEQQAIASVLTSMDNELSALEAKRKKYEQIKQGMMQQLLTGRIRLKIPHPKE